MSDLSAHISIGGNLPQSKVEAFIQVVLDSGAGWDWDCSVTREYILERAECGEVLDLYDSTAGWGNFPGIESFCEDNGLSFVRYAGGDYEYDPDVVWCTPYSDGIQARITDADEYLVVRIGILRSIMKQPDPIQALQRLIQGHTVPEIPPLVIVEG